MSFGKMSIGKMAWRNVWRNKRRSWVTILAMTLALFSMIQYSGFMNGYRIDLERSAIEVEMGNVQVCAKEYINRPSLYHNVPSPQRLLEKIDQLGPGYEAASRIVGNGLAASSSNSAAAVFKGVEVKRDKKVSEIYKRIRKGKWLASSDEKGVVIGGGLARILAIGVGDEIVLLASAMDGSMANDIYRVRGIVAGGGSAVDRMGVFLHRKVLRGFLSAGNIAHRVMVRLHNSDTDEQAAKKIQQLAPMLAVRTWKQISPQLASMVRYMGSALLFMYIIVYIAIGIVVLNAMLMAVFERISEFGILKALGAGPGSVFALICTETMIITGCSILGASILSVPVGIYLSNHGIDLTGQMDTVSISGVGVSPVMKAVFDVHSIVAPMLVLMVMIGLAVLYPALKAALIQPVKAIHHQ